MRNVAVLSIVVFVVLGISLGYLLFHQSMISKDDGQSAKLSIHEQSLLDQFRSLPEIKDASEISRRFTVNCLVVVYNSGLLNSAKLGAEMEQRGWSVESGPGSLVQLTFRKPGWRVLATQGIQDDRLRISLCQVGDQ